MPPTRPAAQSSLRSAAAGSQKPNPAPPVVDAGAVQILPPTAWISSRRTNRPRPAPAAWLIASGDR
jgi:hypothetical protein